MHIARFHFCFSTLSSAFNTISGILYEDFLYLLMPADITEKRISDVLKLIVLCFGCWCLALVFVIEQLGGLLPVAVSLAGMTAGPLLGLFSMGLFIPRINAKVNCQSVDVSQNIALFHFTTASLSKALFTFVCDYFLCSPLETSFGFLCFVFVCAVPFDCLIKFIVNSLVGIVLVCTKLIACQCGICLKLTSTVF